MSSGGKRSRRGCRSSASPPPACPGSGGIRYPANDSPGTHVHTHQDTYAHRTQAGKRVERRRKHAHMRTCKEMEHAGKRHTLLNGLNNWVHTGKGSHVCMHKPVKATSVSDKQSGTTPPHRSFRAKHCSLLEKPPQ